MTDGKIKLIMPLWLQVLFISWSLSILLNSHVRHSLLTPPNPQVHPFGEIHHLGEFLPLHLSLQSIDFGWTISNAEQGEAPGGLCFTFTFFLFSFRLSGAAYALFLPFVMPSEITFQSRAR